MCFDSLAWATKQELPAMQKIVLVMLADHNSKSGLCFPSYDTLAKECGMTKRSVINQVEKLEAAGLLTIEHFKNRCNRYVLNVPASESVALGGESLSLGSESLSPEPVIKPITKPINIITTTASEEILENRDLTAEEQECFDWASVHQFWFAVTVSTVQFLKIYNRNSEGGLKQQFDAHKKARDTWTVNGLNSEIHCKTTGGNYETRGKFNQYARVSRLDSSDEKCKQLQAEFDARSGFIDGFATTIQ